MKLFIEGKKEKKSAAIYSGLILKGEDFKPLKIGSTFYPFIDDDGTIGKIGGIFKTDPVDVTDPHAFSQAASHHFEIEPEYSEVGDADQITMNEETHKLKCSRIIPTYIDIQKIKPFSFEGESFAFIEGQIHRAKDPRLDFYSPEESTNFGSGSFNPHDIKALFNGNYIHLKISENSEEIESIVEKQIEAFKKYGKAITQNDYDKVELYWEEFDHTQKLLKPHANEIYGFDGVHIYYINNQGYWQTYDASSLRDLDMDDRLRISTFLKKEGLLQNPHRLFLKKERISDLNFQDRSSMKTLAPVLFEHLKKNPDDPDSYNRRLSKLSTLNPKDGPLAPADLPGLKEGTELLPHQSYVLAALKDPERMLIDADPGAGKSMMIMCDIIQQMKAKKVHRPLVLMPESLLGQFANEVKHFTHFNPWIINTESVNNWKDANFIAFLDKAKAAPINTIFLTSYNWISRDYEEVDNGMITERGANYRKTKIFPRPILLMNDLGIDGVWQDECHILKNASNRSKAASYFSRLPVVRGFTGTIMPGNPYDVTGAMSVIHSGVFGTEKEFLDKYTNGNIYSYKTDAPKKIREDLKNFGVVSVRKSAWLHLLPAMHKEYHYVDFTPDQKKAYEALLKNILDEIRKDPTLSKLLEKFEDAIEDSDDISSAFLSRFVPLDIFVNAPSEAKRWLKTVMTGKNAESPKIKAIESIIKNHSKKKDHGKILVLTQFKKSAQNLLDQLDPSLKSHAAYYEGGMVDTLHRFLNPHDPLEILFGVDKTLVLGKNLQVANCIIHADLKWQSGDMAQREARAARIGQQREVFIHNVIVKKSAEVLKMARLISQEHIVAKANSNFEDKKTLQPVQMTLSNMLSFNEEHQLKPYLERRKEIEKQMTIQAKTEETFYGPTLLKPKGYAPVSELEGAKILSKVPSTSEFEGSEKVGSVTEKQLDELPKDPLHPKYLELGILNWDDQLYLFSYKSADPTGFVRRLGFTLFIDYYYFEVSGKGEIPAILKKLENKVDVTNLDFFKGQVRKVRVMDRGKRLGLTREAQKERLIISAAKEDKGEVELYFSTVNNAPIIWSHDIYEGVEVEALKKAGFTKGPAQWRRIITRSTLSGFLNKLKTKYPQVRVKEWENFKRIAQTSFRGLNLDMFDDIGEKK
jgi:SNF2 family DNA or RNA helicase